MLRFVHALVFALVASLGIASGARALGSESALRKNFERGHDRVSTLALEALGTRQQNASHATTIVSGSTHAARGAVQTAGRGSTAALSKGTTVARNLREQLAIEKAMLDPTAGTKLPLKMTDPRWPAAEGWTKMQQVVNSGGREGPINVHYLLNEVTGAIDDFKIVLPGAR